MDNKFYQAFCAQGILSPTLEVGPALIFGLGLAGESGEVADIIKKQYGYGRKLNLEHLSEELGDVMWYVANICTTYGLKLDDVLEQNVQKLRERYKEMYDGK